MALSQDNESKIAWGLFAAFLLLFLISGILTLFGLAINHCMREHYFGYHVRGLLIELGAVGISWLNLFRVDSKYANKSGLSYGLTILSPIRNNGSRAAAQDLALRQHLSALKNNEESPFAKVPGTHFVRLVVMDDVVFVGYPARDEHLKSQYLICTIDFDGDLNTYLQTLAGAIPGELDKIWNHCVGYPGAGNPARFAEYMKRCQLETSLYFSDVNDRTLDETLKALLVKKAVTSFVEQYQRQPASIVQQAFKKFHAGLSQPLELHPGVKEI